MDTQTLADILQKATAAAEAASDLQALQSCRVEYLGKKGLLTEQLKSLGQLPPDERPAAGQKINTAKVALEVLLTARESVLKESAVSAQLASESIDVTLSGRTIGVGSLHPVTKTMMELKSIFSQMGFSFMEGPEIEDDYHNFTALNIPPMHPARAMQDTFYFPDGLLLRTHMSPVQIRTMKETRPPLRMAAMGKVYRHDFDVTHTPMFHQMECLLIDKHISFTHLKWLLKEFLSTFFEAHIPVRFRPGYFPFTEPSAEVDIGCLNCKSKGCRICKQTGYLEILGCGMVHPNVLTMADIDPKHFRGFAWGLGIDRLAMLKYGIPDLRSLFENDLRFLKQF
ncbi:MAG TPA: phenylalanine--tRNA ligase subunit alpha [Gammaproteobacteria bacterium]|jgi:phenylalanyl-tRNA synthetase alpha chain|nr:phenylalanine--tRNA ligase subunit alpha [Gammaproteobacteria bacterium]